MCFVFTLIRGLSKNLTDIGGLLAKFLFGAAALAAACASFFEMGVGNLYWKRSLAYPTLFANRDSSSLGASFKVRSPLCVKYRSERCQGTRDGY